MSSSAVLSLVSSALQSLLTEGLAADPSLPATPVSVVLDDPTKPALSGANANRLSLYLYQVTPDEFLRNLPAATVNNSKKQVLPPPLVLNLYYLVTPLMTDAASSQRVLGRAMLTLHSSPILLLHNPDDVVNEEVRISLATDQFDERIRLWEALGQTFQLSACYVVRTVRIDQDPQPAPAPVGEATAGLGVNTPAMAGG